MRDIMQAAKEGNERAQLALEVFAYRLKKYIGAYTAVLGQVDGLVFTGGIGRNAMLVRQMALEGMDTLGLLLDKEANETITPGQECEISASDSGVRIMVIPTNEELLIGRQSLEVAKTLGGA